VIAWLGAETETSHEAISFLKKINDGGALLVKFKDALCQDSWDKLFGLGSLASTCYAN